MRNNSFFEKLTGSLRLSDDDLSALNEPENQTKQDDKSNKSTIVSSKKKTDDDDYDEIIEEVDEDDFEIPDDENIETIEEIIEDDSIDEEEVEEYYEEIIDEEEDDEIAPNVKVSVYGDANKYAEDVEVNNTHDDYPVFKLKSEDSEDEEIDENTNSPLIKVEHHEEVLNTSNELPIDLFEMHNEVVLRVLVPGITPENLKVSITRDHVSLTCTRPSPDGIKDSSYFEREIPYGDFTRMIHLPSDVDVEHAEAVEKYGLLIIRLPKLDSKKVQELKIKSV